MNSDKSLKTHTCSKLMKPLLNLPITGVGHPFYNLTPIVPQIGGTIQFSCFDSK